MRIQHDEMDFFIHHSVLLFPKYRIKIMNQSFTFYCSLSSHYIVKSLSIQYKSTTIFKSVIFIDMKIKKKF